MGGGRKAYDAGRRRQAGIVLGTVKKMEALPRPFFYLWKFK